MYMKINLSHSIKDINENEYLDLLQNIIYMHNMSNEKWRGYDVTKSGPDVVYP